jgi:ABC-type branched-subunit amino acid transport system substrate-binding protein
MLSFSARLLLLGLLVCVIAGNSIIFFADSSESRATLSELVTITAATGAVLLAAAIAFRQNVNTPHGKTFISLAIGLVLWLCADVMWAAYELYYHVAAPIPSVPDILWLLGYLFFAYNLFVTYKEFQVRVSKKILLATIVGNAIFLGYLIPLTIGLSDLTSPAGIAMFLVLIAYPISNAILTIPAIPILFGLWKDKPWSIPWTFKALSLFCIVVTDSWFAFIVTTGLQEQVWLASMLFSAEYLIMAGGLIWYNKFLRTYNYNDESAAHKPSHSHDNDSSKNATSKKLRGKREEDAVAHSNKIQNRPQIEKRKRPIDIIAAVVLIALVIGYGTFKSQTTVATQFLLPADGREANVKVGALIPLTGTLSTFGESNEAALKIALKDINEHFSKANSTTRIELIVEDTKTDPNIAIEKIKALKSQGVQIVIGPATSAAVSAVKEYADKNGILLISPSSTAPQLSIPNDNLYRLVPDDSHQAQAMAKKMWQDGVRVIVPMWRSDIFGEGLYLALKADFEKLGGRVIDGIGYKPPTGDFSASLHRINFIFWEQDLKALESRVNEAVKQYGADKVGVYAVSYDEIVPIMIQAARHQGLSVVKWYGSDGSALNAGLVKNEDAANFAFKTSFSNPIYAVDDEKNERFIEVNDHITKEIGHTHRSYAELAYDALWVAALTYDDEAVATLQVSQEIGDGHNNDTAILRKIFLNVASSYEGITGKTILNDAGDRVSGSYDFWSITSKNDEEHAYEWKRIETIHDVS